MMSSAASNYGMTSLIAGIVGVALSFLVSAAVARRAMRSSTATSLFLIVATLLYGVMMFGSSYVEEEQHFWYWIASGWVMLLYLSRYVLCLMISIDRH